MQENDKRAGNLLEHINERGQLVLASGNAGKVRELRALFARCALRLDIVPQSELGVSSVAETGLSFLENAVIKARNASKETGLPALADDSGLVVAALEGRPGIYSARFAGENASDEDNNRELLRQLSGVPEAQRKAYYFCVLVLMPHAEHPTPLIAEGRWSGRIMQAADGSGGFGYDPLFWSSEKHCVAAQLSLEEKSRLSHRGKAMRALLERLLSLTD